MDRFRAFTSQMTTDTSYINFFIYKLSVFITFFGILWNFFGNEALLPYGSFFHLWMIFIAAYFAGRVTGFLNLPPLLGMMIAGFIYGNVLDIELNKTLTSILRSFALMVILLRAGLSLDLNIIKKLSFVCIRLSILPCIIEAIVLAAASSVAFGLNWSWSLMLGFVVASVSPAVVVPSMIELQERQIGIIKGIPTLVTAAASVDNVIAITFFSVFFSLAFSTGTQSSLLWPILNGLIEVLIGISIGLAVGYFLWYIPEKCYTYPKGNTEQNNIHRFIILLFSSTLILFSSKTLNYSSSGPLAILVLAFIASYRWRPFGVIAFQEDNLKMLWFVLENYLFCLIAADVRLKMLETNIILYGLACLLVALLFRVVVAFAVTYKIGFNYKERFFVALAWIPKASVQAAIGATALDAAVTSEELKLGRLVLTMAVLSILLTAPLGAVAIDYGAIPMLGLDEDNNQSNKRSNDKNDYEQLEEENSSMLQI